MTDNGVGGQGSEGAEGADPSRAGESRWNATPPQM
jgi:hypothetical protein